MIPQEEMLMGSIHELILSSEKNQEALTKAVLGIENNTEKITNLFKSFDRTYKDRTSKINSNQKNNYGKSNETGMIIDSTTGRIRTLSRDEERDKITKQQMTTVINTLTKGFGSILSPLNEISGGISGIATDVFNQFAKINREFGDWAATFNKLPWTNSKFLTDLNGEKSYQGSLTGLLKDLTSGKKLYASRKDLEERGLQEYAGRIIDLDPNSKTFVGTAVAEQFTGMSTSLTSIVASTGAVVAPVLAIAAAMAVLTFLVESIKKGVGVIQEREKDIRTDSYYTENLRGLSLDARREEWLIQAMGIQELRNLSHSQQKQWLENAQERINKGEEVSYTPAVKNPFYTTNLYGTQTASVAGFSGTIMSIKEQIAAMYNVLKDIRHNVAGGSQYGQMILQWQDRMNVSGLASGELFKTATRWYGDAGSILNNIYSQVYNTSEHLNVTADTLLSVGSSYAKYLKASTKSSAEFDADMEQIIHVAGVLEDYGINASKWLEDMHSFGKGTLSSAADNPLWTGMSMVGINPVEAYGAIASGDLGQLSKDSMIKYQNFFRQFSGTDIASKNTRAILASQMGIDAELADQLANNSVSVEEAFAQFGERSKGPTEKQLDAISQVLQDLSEKRSAQTADIQNALNILMYGTSKAGVPIYSLIEKISATLSSFQRSVEKFLWGDVKRTIDPTTGKQEEVYTAGALAKWFGVGDSIVYTDLDKGTSTEYDLKKEFDNKSNSAYKFINSIPFARQIVPFANLYSNVVEDAIISNIEKQEDYNSKYSILGKTYDLFEQQAKDQNITLQEVINNKKSLVEDYIKKNNPHMTNTEIQDAVMSNLGWALEKDDKFFKLHATGISNIPYDNYPALLHKSERVLNATENAEYTQETIVARMALKQFIVNSAEHPMYVAFDQSEIIKIRQILESQYASSVPAQEETLQQEIDSATTVVSNDISMYV